MGRSAPRPRSRLSSVCLAPEGHRLAMPPAPCTAASHLHLWAKSPPNGESDDGYPLLPHLLDVAAVASQLQQTIPCPVPLPCSPAWVCALVGFHDLGKATPGFQQKLGRRCVRAFPRCPAGAPDRHDASTLPLLVRQLEERLGVPGRDAKHFAAAVAAHHGHLINAVDAGDARRSAKHLEAPWHEAHEQLFNDVLEGVGVGTNGLPELPPKGAQRAAFLQWLMGLTTVSDWIGSSENLCRWDRLKGWADDPDPARAGMDRLDGSARRGRCPAGIAGPGVAALSAFSAATGRHRGAEKLAPPVYPRQRRRSMHKWPAGRCPQGVAGAPPPCRPRGRYQG